MLLALTQPELIQVQAARYNMSWGFMIYRTFYENVAEDDTAGWLTVKEEIERLVKKRLDMDATAGSDPQNVRERIMLVWMDEKATYDNMSIEDVRW